MRDFDTDDYETPIEELDGYIGHTWDSEPSFGPELRELDSIDWRRYHELLTDAEEHQLVVAFGSAPLVVELSAFRESGDIAWLLEELPTIDVFNDAGPPDGGPASGSGYIFFIGDGTTMNELRASVAALAAAARSDIARLSNNPG